MYNLSNMIIPYCYDSADLRLGPCFSHERKGFAYSPDEGGACRFMTSPFVNY